ncbi:MAG: hypothetical protein WAV38_03745 [Xanthobacteraceae bacterium]
MDREMMGQVLDDLIPGDSTETLAFVSQAMTDRKTHRSDSVDGASFIIE